MASLVKSVSDEIRYGYPTEILESTAKIALNSVLESGSYGFEFSRQIMDYLKDLSLAQVRYYAEERESTTEEFHARWLAEKLTLGWRYEPRIANEERVSKDIFPFKHLPVWKKEQLEHFRDIILTVLENYRNEGPGYIKALEKEWALQ